jgi:hypothetical protein
MAVSGASRERREGRKRQTSAQVAGRLAQVDDQSLIVGRLQARY